MSKRTDQIQRVIETATSHVGVRSRAMRVNPFGARTGTEGLPWNGAFLETVFRESGEKHLPALTSTTAALAEYVRANRLHRTPRVGDIVFFGFSNDPLGQPHVGLVVAVNDWKTLRTVKTIEGMTATGLPRGPQEQDGVYARTRHNTDILAFARPEYGKTQKSPLSKSPITVRLPQIQPSRTGKGVTAVQQALHETVDLRGARKGLYDSHTVAAMARFQRRIGLLQHDGVPNEPSLIRLSEATNGRYFDVRKGTDA